MSRSRASEAEGRSGSDLSAVIPVENVEMKMASPVKLVEVQQPPILVEKEKEKEKVPLILDPYSSLPSASKQGNKKNVKGKGQGGKGKGKEVMKTIGKKTTIFFDSPQLAKPLDLSLLTTPIKSTPYSNGITTTTHDITKSNGTPSSTSTPLANSNSTPTTNKSYLPPPSHRTDLNPNLMITKIDVESHSYIAGRGKIISGTSKDWVEIVRVVEDVEMEEEQIEEEGLEGWKGWKRLAEVESGFDGFRIVKKEEAKEDDWICVKVRLFFILSIFSFQELTAWT